MSELEAREQVSCRGPCCLMVPKVRNMNVDHPAHYNTGKIEVIDAIEDWKLGFNDGNAVKYIARAKYKGREIEDLEKAIWYLKRQIQVLRTAEFDKTQASLQSVKLARPRRR